MLCRLTGEAREVGIDRVARHPGQPRARKHERPGIPILARHPRVDKDVLKLAGPAAARRTHPEAGPTMAKMQLEAATEVDGLAIVASRAAPDLEPRRRLRPLLRRNHLHELPHDTETQASGKIDASAARPWANKAAHGFDVGPGEARLSTARTDVKLPQRLGGHRRRHPLQPASREPARGRLLGGLLPLRRGEGGGVEPPGDARPVALEGRQDQKTRAHAGESGVEVGGVFVGDDSPVLEEQAHLAPPDIQERTHVASALGGHASEAGDPTAAQQMQDDAFNQVVGAVRDGDDLGAGLEACALEECVAKRAGRSLERTFGDRLVATFGDQWDADALAQVRDLARDRVRTFAKRVVEMRRHNISTGLVEGQEQGCRIRAARDRDEDSAGGNHSHGGAGWTRTTDNAIMSRALYHLSYGTAGRDATWKLALAP